MQFIGIHLSRRIYIAFPEFSSRTFGSLPGTLSQGTSGHQKFSGFSWLFSGKVRFFTFRVLPFGLNSACFCFMKLLRPLVKRRRSMDHCYFLYLDDGISRLPGRVSAFAETVGSIKRT